MYGAICDSLLPVRHLSLGRHSQELRRKNILLRSSNNPLSLTGARTFVWPSLTVQCDVFLLSAMGVSAFGAFPPHLCYGACHLLGLLHHHIFCHSAARSALTFRFPLSFVYLWSCSWLSFGFPVLPALLGDSLATPSTCCLDNSFPSSEAQ